MGFVNRNSGGKWLQVKGGKFVEKNGDNYLEHDGGWCGTVTGITFEDKQHLDHPKYRAVTIQATDGRESIRFSVGCGNGYGRSLLMKLANCDITQPIEFSPAVDRDNPKSGSFFLRQNGVVIKQKWTRDNPGALPDLVFTEFKGKKLCDDTNRQEWLEDYYRVNVFPKIVKPVASTVPPSDEAPDGEDMGDDVGGDIPF